MVSIGNNKARKTALSNPVSPILFLNTPHRPSYSIKETQALQALGGKAEGKGWIYIRGKIALPENLAHTLITDIHQSLHIGPRALNQFLQPLFYYPSLPKVIEAVHRACETCSAINAQGGIRRPGPNHQLRGHQPGEDWQLDFTHMPRHKAFRDQVLLRNLQPGSLQTRWTGPHTVILTTPTAAKLLGHTAWVHINNLKRAPTGIEWTSQMVGPTKLRLARAPSHTTPEPPDPGSRM
ncbi:unnamed protein product [Nyctereutes procyonoides]|uniref:(raccoon dog) hypothetical protein n=1 Tax=Nyctereutes procyonoides TaxID=34880 RepID=A0A811Z4D4_NYCPR|nr:unnamed protein product [Nyctereutes procyonoides]